MEKVEPFPVIVHPFSSSTRKSSAYELGDTKSRNALVFIGGLNDGPHTTPYIWYVAKKIEEAASLSYSVFEIRMRSSYLGFGSSSLSNDVEDISALVKYLRGKGKEKIVLMGHSTGTQDCMEYTNYAKHKSEPVDGFILQAPVSDRDGMDIICPNWEECLAAAEKMIREGKSEYFMPIDQVPSILGGTPITAYRLHSLMAKGGDDDYFSADLEDKDVLRYWGRFKKPVLVLHSEKDEFIPEGGDQAAMNKRYREANPSAVSSLSGLIPGTGHTVLDEEGRQLLSEKVIKFLETEV